MDLVQVKHRNALGGRPKTVVQPLVLPDGDPPKEAAFGIVFVVLDVDEVPLLLGRDWKRRKAA